MIQSWGEPFLPSHFPSTGSGPSATGSGPLAWSRALTPSGLEGEHRRSATPFSAKAHNSRKSPRRPVFPSTESVTFLPESPSKPPWRGASSRLLAAAITLKAIPVIPEIRRQVQVRAPAAAPGWTLRNLKYLPEIHCLRPGRPAEATARFPPEARQTLGAFTLKALPIIPETPSTGSGPTARRVGSGP